MPPRLVALLLLAACGQAAGQVCRVSAAGLNQARRVMGPVHAECPPSVHTAPFGNWGVTSNFGHKGDSHQFDGWCANSRVCDNNGSCRIDCTEGHFEWNSCTDTAQYRPPNCTLYNWAECTEQVSTTGINIHGTRVTDMPVSCPVDANGDNLPDTGGCKDIASFSPGTNFMSLYELDPGTSDELIQTVYFPDTPISLDCTVWNCAPKASNWVKPVFYDSPKSPAKVDAEMAALVNDAYFVNNNGACRIPVLPARAVSAAAFTPAVAPGGIVSLFGNGMSTGTATAAALPLPQTLSGTTVKVVDSLGTSRPAALFFVSPGQVNIELPAGTAPGQGSATIQRQDGIAASAPLQVNLVAPALFSANASGRGVAAAVAVRVSGTVQTTLPVFRCDGQQGSCIPVPLEVPAGPDQLILLLFGTGIRGRGATPAEVLFNGIPGEVLYAGPQNQYPGLDQVNVRVPLAAAGLGEAQLTLRVGNLEANTVTCAFQ